jgi:hypothetical protein
MEVGQGPIWDRSAKGKCNTDEKVELICCIPNVRHPKDARLSSD